MEKHLKEIVVIDEKLFGFMPREKNDGCDFHFQVQKKRLEGNKTHTLEYTQRLRIGACKRRKWPRNLCEYNSVYIRGS